MSAHKILGFYLALLQKTLVQTFQRHFLPTSRVILDRLVPHGISAQTKRRYPPPLAPHPHQVYLLHPPLSHHPVLRRLHRVRHHSHHHLVLSLRLVLVVAAVHHLAVQGAQAALAQARRHRQVHLGLAALAAQLLRLYWKQSILTHLRI